jgi:hypothetical protein
VSTLTKVANPYNDQQLYAPALIVHNDKLFGAATSSSFGGGPRGALFQYVLEASTLSATGTTLNGNLIADGGESCECAFDYGPTAAYGSSTPWVPGFITGDLFSTTVSGLPHGTYHFCAKARNSIDVSFGSDQTFIAPTTAPTVDTTPAADITYNSVTLNGDLTDDGGEACQVYFEWGFNTGYGNTTPLVSDVISSFSAALTGLTRYSIYHYRAVAVNSVGTSYGADVEFDTLQAPPTVETDAASNLLMTAATLNGTLIDDGADKLTCQARFNYGPTAALGTVTAWQPVTLGQAFLANITSLLPGKIYYFRAESENDEGSNNGSTLSFQTTGLPNRAYSISRRKL